MTKTSYASASIHAAAVGLATGEKCLMWEAEGKTTLPSFAAFEMPVFFGWVFILRILNRYSAQTGF